VVKKPRAAKEYEAKPYRERPAEGERQNRSQRQDRAPRANGPYPEQRPQGTFQQQQGYPQQQNYPQQQTHGHQIHAQQQQQQLYAQQQQLYAQQAQEHQQQAQPEFVQPGGEDLIMGLSKAIEIQLAEIAEKTRMLLQMKTELETIHVAGKDQLSTLQDEKVQLLSERERLTEQLKTVEERLIVVDVAIDKAEKEKLFKLKDLQRKSASHGLITQS
jgi:hypothetical protein